MYFFKSSAIVFLFVVIASNVKQCDENIFLGAVDPNATATPTASNTPTPTATPADTGDESRVDSDFDGLSDDRELEIGTRPLLSDTDFDGYGDGLEFVSLRGDPLDNQESPTSENRSTFLSNSEAIRNDFDRDQDGLGDSFESANGLIPDDADTDADGFSDSLELIAESNPFLSSSIPVPLNSPVSDDEPSTGAPPADPDLDSLANEIESLNGSRSDLRDSDGDGFSDGIELVMGSSSTDFLSIPEFTVADPAS